MPSLTQIAHLDWLFTEEDPAHLLPDILIFRTFYGSRIDFRVVYYRTNHSTRFSVDVDVDIMDSIDDIEVFFFLSKTLKLASNNLLARHSRRRRLLSSFVNKAY